MKKIKTTKTFDWAVNSKSRINVAIGGAGSGKSYAIAQMIISKLYSADNVEIGVFRKTGPALKNTIYKLMLELLDEYRGEGKRPTYLLNKTDMVISYGKNRIKFASIDDPARIMSSEFNVIFLEEGIEFSYDDFRKIMLRLRRRITGDHINQIFIACNPVDINSWVKTKLIDGIDYDDVNVSYSTHKDNPWIDPTYKAELESYTGAFRAIFTEGKWVASSELVYTDWKVIPGVNFREIEEITYGVDWGFNHKAALIACYWKSEYKCIWEELLYKGGLTQHEFSEKVYRTIPGEDHSKYIFVDSAEQGLIKELYDMDLNVHNANKAVLDGISTVKQKLIGVTESSKNLIREMRGYSWKKDKEGKILDEPVKSNDDLVDAGRYATHSYQNIGYSRLAGNLRTGEWYD